MRASTDAAEQDYSAPHWPSIVDEITCPLCEYNLRGLTEPRCPECGYRFGWPEVLDPARRKHPYLFEHHSESNLWSFWRTLAAGWRPKQFWTELNPAQRVHPWRLLAYWVVVSLGFSATAMFGATVWNRLNLIAALDDIFDDEFGAFFLFMLWPCLVFSSLQVFRWSMRKARVSPRHVLRCVVYAHDVLIWPCFVASGIWGVYLVLILTDVWPHDRLTNEWIATLWGAAMFGGLLLSMFRLHRAYRFYMRFDHVVPMLLCVVVISLLTLANLLLFITF